MRTNPKIRRKAGSPRVILFNQFPTIKKHFNLHLVPEKYYTNIIYKFSS